MSRVTVSLFSVYGGHRFTYMFIIFSKQKETQGVSSVAYYILVSVDYPITGIHVFSTESPHITVNVHLHGVMSVEVETLN